MQPIKWSPALELKIEEIDRQHQKLVKLFNALVAAGAQTANDASVSGVLTRMVDYIDYHFGTEETYMRRFNYPELRDHRQEHRAFIQKTFAFRNAYLNQEATLSAEVLRFLHDWIINHLQGTDTRYVACFKANGLK